MATYIGRGVKRLEDPQLVTGAGTFIDDHKLPEMLHAAVLRSSHAHTRIKSIDVRAARELPGVVAVASASDLQGINSHLPVPPAYANTELTPPAHPLLAIERVRYVGEPVAVVVAEDQHVSRDALAHIQVEYEPIPVVVDPNDALKDQVVLHEDLGTNVVLRMDHRHGDLEDSFRRADRIVRGQYKVQRLAPAPMENRGVVASYDEKADLLSLWTSAQSPHRQKREMVQVLRRDPKTVRVIVRDVGGGFGQKVHMKADEMVVSYLAIKIGRPIKSIENRTENMTSYHGRDMTGDIEAAVSRDGTILGLRAHILCDMGAYIFSPSPVPPNQVAVHITGAYKIAALHIQVRGVATNKPPAGPYRGAGQPEAIYFIECTIDKIAAELGLDPVEVRKKNLVPSDAFPYTNPMGVVYESGDYTSVLGRATELAKYQELRREQAQARAEGRLMGIGTAAFVKGAGGSGPLLDSTAKVEIEPHGQVRIITEASPHGQGSDTTFAQIAADALGIVPQDVTVLHGDTDMLEVGIGTVSSRGVMVSGSAVYQVMQQARQKVAQIGADMFACSPEEVEFQDSHLFPRNTPERRIPFADVAARAFQEETLPPGLTPGLEFTASITIPNPAFSFGAHIAVAEVDRDTGEVKLLRFVGVHDCGKIINPTLAEGQFQGGLMQGIGQAMSETMIYDQDGQPQTSTFLDYAMPLATDMPDLVLDTWYTPSPTNPLEARGIGEVSTVGSPAAVANAVLDALSPLGVRHLDTPFTSENVWRIIQQVES